MKIWITILYLFLASPAFAMELPAADSPAAKLYAQRCSGCHALAHPGRLDWEQWRHMLHVMKQRMSERAMELPADEWKQIAGYLKRNAR